MRAYLEQARRAGELVVQPRMGMATAEAMAQGLAAVRAADARTVGTMTLDSYTRVGDHDGARRALRQGEALNGFPSSPTARHWPPRSPGRQDPRCRCRSVTARRDPRTSSPR